MKSRIWAPIVVLLVALWLTARSPARAGESDVAVANRLKGLQGVQAKYVELAAERDKLGAQLKTFAMQFDETQKQIFAWNQQLELSNANLTQLNETRERLNAQLRFGANAQLEGQIQNVKAQINVTTLTIGKLNDLVTQTSANAQKINALAAQAQRTLQGILAKLDKQQVDFIDQADLFDRLSRAEQEPALGPLNGWIKVDEQHCGALLTRAFVNRKLGNVPAAMDDLTAVVDAGGSLRSIALAARGELSVASGNTKDGLADLAQAYKLNKKDARILILRGIANWRLGKLQTAEADFMSALRLDKNQVANQVAGYRLLALLKAASESRDAKKAIDNGKRAIELTKSADWSCYYALAAAHAEAGDYAEASRAASEASKLAVGDNRELCDEQAKLYAAHKPLRFKWK